MSPRINIKMNLKDIRTIEILQKAFKVRQITNNAFNKDTKEQVSNMIEQLAL